MELYHYTKFSIWKNIVRPDGITFFVTRFSDLGDKSEYRWVIEQIINKAEEINKRYDFRDIDIDQFPFIPYILSFCKIKEDPNLWKEYGDNGEGIMLIFELRDDYLNTNPRACNYEVLAEVHYTNEQKFMEDFDYIYERYCAEFEGKIEISDIMDFAPLLKTEPFAHENETRLLILNRGSIHAQYDEIQDVLFTEEPEDVSMVKYNNDNHKHYLIRKFPKMTLKGVLIGNNKENADETINDIRNYLRTNGYNISDDAVRQSKVIINE